MDLAIEHSEVPWLGSTPVSAEGSIGRCDQGLQSSSQHLQPETLGGNGLWTLDMGLLWANRTSLWLDWPTGLDPRHLDKLDAWFMSHISWYGYSITDKCASHLVEVILRTSEWLETYLGIPALTAFCAPQTQSEQRVSWLRKWDTMAELWHIAFCLILYLIDGFSRYMHVMNTNIRSDLVQWLFETYLRQFFSPTASIASPKFGWWTPNSCHLRTNCSGLGAWRRRPELQCCALRMRTGVEANEPLSQPQTGLDFVWLQALFPELPGRTR